MSYYKIGPIVLKIERMGPNFEPFKTFDSDEVDTEVKFLDNPIDISDASIVAEAQDIVIFKRMDTNGQIEWIFKTGLVEENATLRVSSDYKSTAYYCELERNNSGYYILLSRLLLPYISCLATRKGLIVLHSACVYKDGFAVAFSGASGVGKSTRARFWIDSLDAEWISGDRPWIDPKKGVALGTPWDGKECIFKNVSFPIKAILAVKRSDSTRLECVDDSSALNFLATQAFMPIWDPVLLAIAFRSLRNLQKNISFYNLYCDATPEAAFETYKLLMK